jgi:SLBB domain
MKQLLIAAVMLLIASNVLSQDDDLILGNIKNDNAALFDLSDPMGINMEVNLWGFVRYPGRYRVPVKTTFLDLMTYSGGPTNESNLKEIRILRNGNDTAKAPEIIKLNYDDLLWGEKVSPKQKSNPILLPNDVVIVLQERRYAFRDDIGIYLSIITTVVSITTLIITIANQ